MKMYKYCATLVAVFLLAGGFFANFATAAERLRYFPVEDYNERLTVKKFGQNIDANFYRGKEAFFPTKFFGLHAADDLEIFLGEEDEDVPVYAVAGGTVSFMGSVIGYGGVILISIGGENLTVLYGHIGLRDTEVKTGATVKPGQLIAYLGKGFSSETSGERKHLHFALQKSKNQYFRGHEPSQASLNKNWINPQNFLRSQKAIYIDKEVCVLSE